MTLSLSGPQPRRQVLGGLWYVFQGKYSRKTFMTGIENSVKGTVFNSRQRGVVWGKGLKSRAETVTEVLSGTPPKAS